jgi:hypothetical protein
LNGGGEVLKIRTVAGNIEIRKIDAASLQELQHREESTWKAWQNRRAEKERRNQEVQKERRERHKEMDEDDHDE